MSGLCGVMGAGINRMNKYTVGKVTKGHGNYLLETYGSVFCEERGVVIGYDKRNNSEYFFCTAPEDRRTLELVIAQAKRMDADIVFGAEILSVWTLPSRWLTEIWRRFLP